jgi:hypothetical protein
MAPFMPSVVVPLIVLSAPVKWIWSTTGGRAERDGQHEAGQASASTDQRHVVPFSERFRSPPPALAEPWG